MRVIARTGENSGCIVPRLIGVIDLPTVSLSPKGNGYRVKGVAVVLEMFEQVNGPGAGAWVRHALAALFETKAKDPAAAEDERGEILQCRDDNGVKDRNLWRCTFFHNPMSTGIHIRNQDRIRRTQNSCCVNFLRKNDRHWSTVSGQK